MFLCCNKGTPGTAVLTVMVNKAIYAILMVYVGCGLNNVFLEHSISDPGSGHLITFSQFIFIAAHGFIFTYKFGKGRRIIPLKEYLILVFLFFITSVFNNWAFGFHIPVPLHIIFRSGSLMANMILGIIVLKKKYTFSKFLSGAMITVGIIICTLISNEKVKTCADCGDDVVQTVQEKNAKTYWWIVGIVILSTALLLSAWMGIYQESLYARFGKHPEEALYYTHMLSLPFFLLYAPSIIEHFGIATASEMYRLPVLEIELPILCLFIIGNMLTQYMCISSVYVLTTKCASLTVTLVITLRKFFSLLFSKIYFQNPFTWMHWFGTALVFIGTLIFAEVVQNIPKLFVTKKIKTKN